MMRKQLIAIVCLLLCIAAGAHAASHWTVNPHNYQYDMTVYAVLTIGGHALTDYSDYELATFFGEECRGVAKVQTASDGSKYLYLRVYSNTTADETIRFRVYQVSRTEEIWQTETVTFEASSMNGTPGEPMVFVLNSVLKGDANGDGQITAADIVAITNYMMGNPPAGFSKASADVNFDGVINIADIVTLASILLNN